MKIEMVDLKGQYKKIKSEVDQAMIACAESAEFINGTLVSEFSNNSKKLLLKYLNNINIKMKQTI